MGIAARPQRPAGAALQPNEPNGGGTLHQRMQCLPVQVKLFPFPGKPEAFKSVRSISRRELEAEARHRRIDPDEEEAEWYAFSFVAD